MTWTPLVCSVAFAATLSCAGGGTTVTSPETTNSTARDHVVVRFDDMTVNPSVARVLEGGTVGWVNEGDYTGLVTFSAEDAGSLTCQELRPDFTRSADKIQSLPVHGDGEDVVLPCPFEPGEYEYVIELSEGVEAMYDPVRKLTARIVVGGP